MAELFSSDPITKTHKLFHWNEADESFHIETRQDVTPVVELTRAEYAAMDERTPWKGDMQKVASIPLSIMAELQRTGIWYDDKALNRWLNDSANRAFRTRPGRV